MEIHFQKIASMTLKDSSKPVSAVQHLINTRVLTAITPWREDCLNQIAKSLGTEWDIAVSTDHVVIGIPRPPRMRGFSPSLAAYGLHCNITDPSSLYPALVEALTHELDDHKYHNAAVTHDSQVQVDFTARMSASYLADDNSLVETNQYLYHDAKENVVWAVIEANAADEGRVVLDTLRNC